MHVSMNLSGPEKPCGVTITGMRFSGTYSSPSMPVPEPAGGGLLSILCVIAMSRLRGIRR